MPCKKHFYMWHFFIGLRHVYRNQSQMWHRGKSPARHVFILLLLGWCHLYKKTLRIWRFPEGERHRYKKTFLTSVHKTAALTSSSGGADLKQEAVSFYLETAPFVCRKKCRQIVGKTLALYSKISKKWISGGRHAIILANKFKYGVWRVADAISVPFCV